MIISKFISVIIILLFFIVACNEKKNEEINLEMRDKLLYEIGSDTPFNGTQKTKLRDKIIEYDVVNGVKQGNFKLYYEDSTLQMIGHIEQNLNVGKWQYFYPDGKIESEGNFVNDYPEGKWIWYFQNGNIKEEGDFVKGIRIGKWTFYSEQGLEDSSLIFKIKDSSFVHKDSLIKLN